MKPINTVQRALAYERIPYFLVLKAMIVRYFHDTIPEVPEVRFRRLSRGALAIATGPAEDGSSCIELDTHQCAEVLPKQRIPLLAVLAHELIHISIHKAGAYGRRAHGSDFHAACQWISAEGCPVVTQKKWYAPGPPAWPMDWRRSLAICVHPRSSAVSGGAQ